LIYKGKFVIGVSFSTYFLTMKVEHYHFINLIS